MEKRETEVLWMFCIEQCRVVRVGRALVLYIHICILAYLHPFPFLSISDICSFERDYGHPRPSIHTDGFSSVRLRG